MGGPKIEGHCTPSPVLWLCELCRLTREKYLRRWEVSKLVCQCLYILGMFQSSTICCFTCQTLWKGQSSHHFDKRWTNCTRRNSAILLVIFIVTKISLLHLLNTKHFYNNKMLLGFLFDFYPTDPSMWSLIFNETQSLTKTKQSNWISQPVW